MQGKRIIKHIVVLLLCMAICLPVIPAGAKKSTPKLNKTKITMLRYHSFKLKVKNSKKSIKWKSSNSKTATVDKKGLVTALNTGSVKITAKVGKKKLTCKVSIIEYDPDLVMAAYGYKALTNILPKGSDLKITESLSGTYFSNDPFIYYDCTFKDLSGEKKHAYVHIYRSFGETLAYHNVKTSFYDDNLVVCFMEGSLEKMNRDRCKEISLKKVKTVQKKLFCLESIEVTKGKDFDLSNIWLRL